ncbi:MAG TPA: TldD/PmbA family protein, partial [Clostridia bacterium]|nr:TldD/PmbA family protein [Clostridia bacterium]
MAEDYLAKAQIAVEMAQSQGASMSEAYVSASKETTVEISNQQVEAMKMAKEHGLGIRVILNGKIGFAYSSDLSDSSIKNIVRQAVANAEKTHADEFNILPKRSELYPKLDLVDKKILDTPIEEKITLAKEIENQARAFDKRVKITESTTYQDVVYSISIFNSQGISESYKGAYCGAYAYLVAEENGESQTGFDLTYSLKYKDINPSKIGQEAAQKAVRMLGAKNIATQKAAVVLDPYVATNFLGVLASALSAEAAHKGKSVFSGKVGKKVSSTAITIIDDGALPGAILSSPFDGEGVR